MTNRQKSSNSNKAFAVGFIVTASIIIAASAYIFNGNLNNKTVPSQKEASLNNINSPVSSPKETSSQTDWKDMVDKLESQGYTRQDIDSSQQYVEKVMLNLNEIAATSEGLNLQPAANIPDGENTDSARYTELQSKIDIYKATYLMVKLKKEFKSIESVFDEYLISIQLDMDLNDYLSDRDKYEKSKNEKMSGKDITGFITVEQIERKMLENIQKQNERNRLDSINPNTNSSTGGNSLPGLSHPGVKGPEVEVPRPPDPAEELRKKIGQ
jgi:hypothetical protein